MESHGGWTLGNVAQRIRSLSQNAFGCFSEVLSLLLCIKDVQSHTILWVVRRSFPLMFFEHLSRILWQLLQQLTSALHPLRHGLRCAGKD
ncbi:hypothetical protein L210DRAFT_3555770 [Boletus edulis BED1]|uniref:Uncharacterized protein n=1 Tax=Boletus edulis BED1 TaxID=1328754 RepID=A0AAD4BLB8_BOLED|nr:hypothetical protein L210DRAFT_3555770 [Boletus edulis BED1]